MRARARKDASTELREAMADRRRWEEKLEAARERRAELSAEDWEQALASLARLRVAERGVAAEKEAARRQQSP